MDTTTPTETAQQEDKDATTARTQDTSHIYASQDTQTATDTTQEDQATEDIAADLQVDLLADHPQEAHHTIDAQEDTEAPHHTILI